MLAEPGTGFLGGVAWKQDGQDIYRRQTRAAGIRGERSQYCSRHHGGLKSRVHVEQTDDENIWIDVSGGKNMGILIGRRGGQTLNSLQYLINIIIRRQFENFRPSDC